ncbi:hypothetical protein L7F22_063624 [Adiantum nelumboides]|nr:hypothetical protein [Adiantum nelumboides]
MVENEEFSYFIDEEEPTAAVSENKEDQREESKEEEEEDEFSSSTSDSAFNLPDVDDDVQSQSTIGLNLEVVLNIDSDDIFAHEQSASSLKVSKLLQIVRRWRAAKGRKQATHASPPPMQLRRSSTRPPSCSRLNLVPLRCLSVQLPSDDEDEEATHTHGFFTESNWSPRLRGSQSQGTLPMRALSCPKLGSPLGSCTSFSRNHFDREEEELEYLRPYCGAQEEERTGSISSSKGSSPSKRNLSKQPSTPKGYLALYVGEERKRFLVKASLINHPLFGLLLDKAKEEFGFEQKGPLNIPCEIAFFEHIMLLVESNNPIYRNADRATVLLHLNRKMATTVV